MSSAERGNFRRIVVDGLLLLCAIFCILLFSRVRNQNREMVQIDGYTRELAERTAQHVGDVFQANKNAIESVAYLYGQGLTSIQVDQARLRTLEDYPGFDRIRFVNRRGESYSGDHRITNVRDRDYWKNGMEGKSGYTYIEASRFDGERLVGFYAPVYYGGGICGVMVGFLEMDSVQELLSTDFMGYTANTLLADWDGRVLGMAMVTEAGEAQPANLDQIVDQIDNPQDLWDGLEAGRETGIHLNGSLGQTVAYVVPVKDSRWCLVQAFPPEAAAEAIENINSEEQLVMALFLLAVSFFSLRLVKHLRDRNALERQQAAADRVAGLLGNAADDYICLIDVNLVTEKEEQFKLQGGRELEDWSEGEADYTKCVRNFADKVVCDKDRDVFLEAADLSNLRKIFLNQKDFFVEYDAEIQGQTRRLQGKFTFCPDQFPEPHMIVGIRDITALSREKLKTRTTLDLIVSAASTVYPVIIEENVTRNRAFTVYNQGLVSRGWVEKHYSIDDMIAGLERTVPAEGDYAQLQDMMRIDSVRKDYAAGQREKSIRIRQVGDDGQLHWMEVRNILMENGIGELCAIVMVRCVDSEIRQTEDLRRAKEAAESANRAKSTFLFNMSHDIRTPMNAIMGFSAMAEKHMDDPEKVMDCLEKINLSGEHLLRLINNVLDMARIESGRIELREEPRRLSEVTQAMECLFQADAGKKNLRLEFHRDIRDDIVYIDELRLNQIQLNLIGNAIKYTPEGGSVTVTLEQTGRDEEASSYCLKVRDTGIGMSEEFQKNVFEAFERERKAVSSGIEGTGLGLSITKRLAQEMGGTVSCTSEQGMGSEFVCTFRFRRGTAQELEDARRKPEAPLQAGGKRILLVEDNALNREISREILETDGFQVEEAEDGDIAVDKVRRSAPGDYGLVLMDVQMPRMNGYEATRRIRALDNKALAQIPIIAVTANAFEEDRQEAVRAGMNGHVAKPIDVNLLRKEIAKWM